MATKHGKEQVTVAKESTIRLAAVRQFHLATIKQSDRRFRSSLVVCRNGPLGF
jgi:hypothetical protein